VPPSPPRNSKNRACCVSRLEVTRDQGHSHCGGRVPRAPYHVPPTSRWQQTVCLWSWLLTSDVALYYSVWLGLHYCSMSLIIILLAVFNNFAIRHPICYHNRPISLLVPPKQKTWLRPCKRRPGFRYLCYSIFVLRMNICFRCIWFGFFSTNQEIGWEKRLQNELFCVESVRVKLLPLRVVDLC